MEHKDIQEIIRQVLGRNRFAVLATHHGGQPHASLMAFTPLEDLRLLAFATYRDTLKYKSIREDRRVAILIEDRAPEGDHSGQRTILTAQGEAIEMPEEDRHAYAMTYLARHPDLESFLGSPDCEFVLVAVSAYQVVGGIDDVQWYVVGDGVREEKLKS
jgi:nitroimidazol reductase NimA-like FMN-containing flavoprotein (pyridoxamine 5'-phosphate oxidase superfamily)